MRGISTLGRYWHTLRWLRPVQFYGRAWFRLHRPRPDLRPAPSLRMFERTGWERCPRESSMLGPDTFRFIGIEHRLADATDWNRADCPKLWLYNAHYFDDLVTDGASVRLEWHRDLLRRWISENPPGRGNGWEPYPASLRIVNWLKWELAGNALDEGMRQSLVVQVRWLRKRLEHHLLGNHLWANAKALVFAGACFDGDEAHSWLRHGLRLMRREIGEQVLADGGHFERSPMYHAILTEDMLDLLQLAKRTAHIPTEVIDSWRAVAGRMLEWGEAMAHPDGGPSFFNDAAFGIAPDIRALRAYASAIGLSPSVPVAADARLLSASGYARLEVGPAMLLADVAPVGPDYLPGHAHADTLSFELSLHGKRVLVNGGTSTYQNDAERQRQRSTAAHNTVVVDGRDSSEVWSAFRVARRARVCDIACSDDGATRMLEARHDGYQRLPGRVTHHRAWRLDATGLQVTDTLDGRFRDAEARFHFAPGMTLDYDVDGGEVRLEPGVWHPRFGESVPIQVLAVRFLKPRCSVHFRWS